VKYASKSRQSSKTFDAELCFKETNYILQKKCEDRLCKMLLHYKLSGLLDSDGFYSLKKEDDRYYISMCTYVLDVKLFRVDGGCLIK
jgi:hypothetical protein